MESIKKILAALFKTSTKRKEAEIKGRQGELNVAGVLKSINGRYLLNVYIPTGYGYSEVDLILLDKTGIYVIEVKNYSCLIKGSDADTYWKAIYANKKEYDLYNPIKQNETHIKAVLSYLGGRVKSNIKSYVVFSKNTDITGVNNRISHVQVCKENELQTYLKQDLSGRPIYTEKELLEIYKLLYKCTQVSSHEKKKHIKRVKKYKKNKKV